MNPPKVQPSLAQQPEVTLLIPNYQTPDITKICLRLIRKHTDLQRIKVIVVDNNSQDESLTYLRTLDWITLLERKAMHDDTPSLSHSRALDLALEQVDTPYVLSFHTDTFVHHPGWLDFLLAEINRDDNIAGVGSWKLEVKPPIRRMLKKIEYWLQSIIFPLLGKGYGNLEGKGDNYYYLRSHCALYRTSLLHKYHLQFADASTTAGQLLHKNLVDNGHKMVFLPSPTLSQYIVHLNHATMVLNPELGSRQRSIRKGLKRIRYELERIQAEAVLADDSLD